MCSSRFRVKAWALREHINRRHIGPKYHYKQGKCQHFFRKPLDATQFESLKVRKTTTFTSTLCPSVICLCGHLPLSHNPWFPKSHVRTEISRELFDRFRRRHAWSLQLFTNIQFTLVFLEYFLNSYKRRILRIRSEILCIFFYNASHYKYGRGH